MLAKHVVALVRRDMAEVIASTVFEHEVAILKDIHGEAAVNIGDTLPNVPAMEIDVAEEFDRLVANYGTNDANQPYAERAFGISSRGLEAFAYRPAKPSKVKAEE